MGPGGEQGMAQRGCHRRARSDQGPSLRPDSFEGALAGSDIMDQIWPKRDLTHYPQPKCQEFQPLPHRPPTVSSGRREFSVFMLLSSLDINLEQTARNMRKTEFFMTSLWAGLSLPLLGISEPNANVYQKANQDFRF